MNSSSYEPGEIIAAPIPFSNQIAAKVRPAMIINNKSYNEKSDDIVVLKITSKVKDYPFDITLQEEDIMKGKLKHASVIMADSPVIVDKMTITTHIGKVSDSKISEVKKKIIELYSI